MTEKNSIMENIKFLSIIAIAATILSKVMGLMREILISSTLGATSQSDAYNIAYLLVITIFGLFSSAYSNSLVPTTAKLFTDNRKKLNSVVNSIITISLLVGLILIALMNIFPETFVCLLASGADNTTIATASRLVRISSWSLIALILSSALAIVLRIFERNVAPSLVAIIFPIPVLAFLVCGIESADILISGVVLGYFAQVFILWICTFKTSYRLKPSFRWKEQEIRDSFAMMPPMLVSSGLLQINTLVDNQVASTFSVGSVTMLQQAIKVNSLAYTVFSTALMQIIYAKLTKIYASNDKIAFQVMIKQQVRWIMIFIIPCAIILPLYSEEIIEMLFLHGNYTVESVKITGSILRGYGIGLILFVLRDILVYIYYASSNSKFPSFVNCIAVIINIFLNFILSGILGIVGIAYATSLSALISFIILACFLRKKVMPLQLLDKVDIYKIIVAGGLDGVLLFILKHALHNFNVWINVLPFICGFLFYWLIIFLFNRRKQLEGSSKRKKYE